MDLPQGTLLPSLPYKPWLIYVSFIDVSHNWSEAFPEDRPMLSSPYMS